MTVDRRTVLRAGLTASAVLAVPSGLLLATAGTASAAPPKAELFTLGVASGEPAPDGFVLWTRLAPDPLAEDGMGREFCYRFRAGSSVSPVGRTRTSPVPTSMAPLTMWFTSCAQFEHGFFTAYARLAEDEPDVVLHAWRPGSWCGTTTRSRTTGPTRSTRSRWTRPVATSPTVAAPGCRPTGRTCRCAPPGGPRASTCSSTGASAGVR